MIGGRNISTSLSVLIYKTELTVPTAEGWRRVMVRAKLRQCSLLVNSYN